MYIISASIQIGYEDDELNGYWDGEDVVSDRVKARRYPTRQAAEEVVRMWESTKWLSYGVISDSIVNLTRDAIVIRVEGRDRIIMPADTPAQVRVRAFERPPAQADEFTIPVVANEYDVQGLPTPQEGTIYIVSPRVLSQVRNRCDVFALDTGSTAIRFADGPHKGKFEAATRLIACE